MGKVTLVVLKRKRRSDPQGIADGPSPGIENGKPTYDFVVIVLESVEPTHDDVIDEVIGRRREGDANKGRQDQFKYPAFLATQKSR